MKYVTVNASKSMGKKIITIECKDIDGTLEKILNHLKEKGNQGSSFGIDMNEGEDKEHFMWDGDGTDHIYDIKVEEKNG